MKVKYVGGPVMDYVVKDNQIADLINGHIYEASPCEKYKGAFYRVIDESGEDYLYPKNFFEVVEE